MLSNLPIPMFTQPVRGITMDYQGIIGADRVRIQALDYWACSVSLVPIYSPTS